MRNFRNYIGAKATFFALALLFTTNSFAGGSSSCSFEKLGTAAGIFDKLEKSFVDRGLKTWHRSNKPKLENWMGITDSQVAAVKTDLVETLSLEEVVTDPNKLQITTNDDGTITIKHGRGSYLFTP